MYPQTRRTCQEHFSDLTNQTMIPESGITEWTHPPPSLCSLPTPQLAHTSPTQSFLRESYHRPAG